MCGICGIWNIDGQPVRKEILNNMNESLRRRGPDESGYHISNNVGLAHRRLSIIDLESGKQPISNQDGTIWITFNGEIYNFLELKKELINKGYIFKTNTDTEVIVNLYEESGLKFINKLRGMFAFAIWDSRKQRLILARDRMGQKPLYYYQNGSRFVFSSELKSLLRAGDIPREISSAGLNAYLTLDYIPAPYTIYENIKKLPPANILIVQKKDTIQKRYWKPTINSQIHNNRKSSIDDFLEELVFRLKESVKIRLMSDVPLGVFLSGGIDSSAIVALMAQSTDQTIKTFSIGFYDNENSELPYAKMIADKYSTDHHEFIVELDSLNVLSDVINAYDEPFADASAINAYYLSKITTQHVTVALSGDGGDELFSGYPWYNIFKEKNIWEKIPNGFKKLIFQNLSSIWPSSWRGGKRLNLYKQPSFEWLYASIRNRFSEHDRGDYFSSDLIKFISKTPFCSYVAEASLECQVKDRVTIMQYADLMTYLPEDILTKIDRVSMWHSLEVRSPLVDHELIEFVFNIPSYLKLSNNSSKYIFKKAIEPWVPKQILSRHKQGFGIPSNKSKPEKIEHLYNFAKDILMDNQTKRRGYYNQKSIKRLLDSHLSRKMDLSVSTNQIWNLLYLELWFREIHDRPIN